MRSHVKAARERRHVCFAAHSHVLSRLAFLQARQNKAKHYMKRLQNLFDYLCSSVRGQNDTV